MKLPTTKKSKILLIAAITAVVLVGGSVSGYMYYSQYKTPADASIPPGPVDTNPPTQEQKDAAEEVKKDKSEEPEKPTTPPAEPTVKMSKLYQDGGSKQVVVQTELRGADWKKCTIIFTKGGAKVEKTAETLYQSSFSTCMGFAIGGNEFSSKGDWKVVLKAEKTDGSVVNSEEKTISIN